MNRLTRLILWLLLTSLPSWAQTIFPLDSLPAQGVPLTKGWQWYPGDNPNWAKPDFDDRHWQPIDPSQEIQSLPQINQAGMGWLRLHIGIDSALAGKVISMLVEQQVASEFYLNGRLIGGFGQFSTDPNQVKAYNPSGGYLTLGQTIHFQLDSQVNQVLSVRFAVQPGIHYLKFFDRPNPFLLVRLHQADQRNQNQIDSAGNFDLMSVDYFKVGMFLILALLHLLFYGLYPTNKVNLWFGLYCFFAAAIYLNQSLFYQFIRSVPYRTDSAIGQWVFFFGAHLFFLGAVYTLFNKRIGVVFYTALFSFSIYLILFISQVDIPTDVGTLLALVLTDIESTRLLLLATRKRGKDYWILTIGAVCFVLLITTALALPLLTISPHTQIILVQGFFNLGVLSLPISMTLFLASQFARTNRSLTRKLKEVEQLSALARVHEQEKQQLLSSQNELLEQQVTSRTAELNQSLAELKTTQTQLIQQAKMASLGKLTRGIMDRILNPLNYINNFSLTGQQLLQEMQTVTQKYQPSFSLDEQDELDDAATMLAQNLNKIHEHGNSTARILQDMRKLLKERSSAYALMDVNPYLTGQVNVSFQKALSTNPAIVPIELTVKLAPQPLPVNLLPIEFADVLDRLIDNSCYSLLEKSHRVADFKPRLEISTHVVDNHVQIQVRDNGRGIKASELKQLFSPFFTTKPTAKGTGLSLYLSKEVVEENLQGQLSIDSVEDEYTQVTVLLPLKREELTDD